MGMPIPLLRYWEIYVCERVNKSTIFAAIKIGEIYEEVTKFSDGLAAVGGLFERSLDRA